MTWKFSVSTLGMPGAPLQKVIDLAAANGCAGVELRVHDDEFLHLGMERAASQAIGERLQEAGLAISALAGYARVCSPAKDRDVIAEMEALITLAGDTGAEAIRVFPGGDGDSDPAEHRVRAHRRIRAVLEQARDAGVRILVETHDSHATGRAALELVVDLEDPGHASVLWDGLHPWRSGESTAETRAALGEHCAYFQVKDAVPRGEKWVPVIPGAGEVPLEEQGHELQDFSGWVSLEWERAWHPQIEPLEEVLPVAAQWFQRWRPPRLTSRPGAGC